MLPSFNRRSIRYHGYDYTQPGAYFVTIASYERKCIFGKIVDKEIRLSDLGKIANTCWQQIPVHFTNVEIEPFVIMPNHLHGIVTILEDDRRGTIYRAPTEKAKNSIHEIHTTFTEQFGKPVSHSLGTIIRTYKAGVSRLARQELGMIKIWQRNYFERIIRDEKELRDIFSYILSNPQTWANDPEFQTQLST